jgi:hypothetical protein
MANNQPAERTVEEDGEDGEAIVAVLVVREDLVVRVVHLMTPTMMMMTTTTVVVEVGIPVVVKIIITTTETMAMLRLEVHHPGL